MPLIVETGTGLDPTANAYADAATVSAYHFARGNTAWTGIDAAKEAAILRAMTYIESLPWNGYKTAQSNPLKWPRSCMEDDDRRSVASNIVPLAVVHALCELALRELSSAGSTMPDISRMDVFSKIEVAGAVSIEVPASAPIQADFPIVRKMLKGLIAPSGGVRLVR